MKKDTASGHWTSTVLGIVLSNGPENMQEQ